MRAVNFFDSPAGMGMSQHHLAPAEAQQQLQHSTWRSPVPYLFGGLAAMMGLIAFALLLLACSYWRLSGYLEEGRDGAGDPETAGGGGKPDDAGAARLPPPPPEQRIVVIMAGDEKPTFLATPVSSRASSFGDNASRGGSSAAGDEDNYKPDQEENRPETATGGDGDVSERQQEGIPESQEDAHQSHDREGVLHDNL